MLDASPIPNRCLDTSYTLSAKRTPPDSGFRRSAASNISSCTGARQGRRILPYWIFRHGPPKQGARPALALRRRWRLWHSCPALDLLLPYTATALYFKRTGGLPHWGGEENAWERRNLRVKSNGWLSAGDFVSHCDCSAII